MRHGRSTTTLAFIAGMTLLIGLAGCGNPGGVDGELTDDWGTIAEPVGFVPVADTRSTGKAHMVLNDATPEITVDPDSFAVRIDGELVTEAPATSLPLAQRYFLF